MHGVFTPFQKLRHVLSLPPAPSIGVFWLTLVLVLATAPPLAWSDTTVTAEAQVHIEVDVGREPPFNAWCVKPACNGPSSLAALTKLPPILAPSLDYGLIEARLRRAVGGALQDAATAVFGGRSVPKPVIDIAQTAAAAVLGDASALDRLGGLGASALRVALAYEMDSIVPADPRCKGPDRIDALYEGLAVSASLLSLQFPLKKGQVPAGCIDVAKSAARAVDAAVVRELVPADMQASLDATLQTISRVQRSCGGIAGASEHFAGRWRAAGETVNATTLETTAQALRHLQAPALPSALRPTPGALQPSVVDAGVADGSGVAGDASPESTDPGLVDEVEKICAEAISMMKALDPGSIEAMVERGFANASLGALVQTFHVPALPCDNPAMCARSQRVLGLLVKFALGTATEGDLRVAVQDLAFALIGELESSDLAARVSISSSVSVKTPPIPEVPPVPPVVREAVAMLGKAVVVHDGVPTIDPSVVAALLASKYEVNAAGIPSLRALIGPSPWIFEVNGGVPNIDFSQGKVVADMSFGYSTKSLGIVGRGAIDEYDLSTAVLRREYAHYYGGLEGWWNSRGPPEGLRIELKLSGSFDYYDTTSYPIAMDGGRVDLTRFYDFDSRIVRAAGVVGLQYGGPRSRITADVHIGGGMQYEDPDTTTFPLAQLLFKSQANFSAHGSGRALVTVRVIPHIVGLRLRGEGEYFDISRSDLTVTQGMFTLSNNRQTQLNIRGRLFVDFDVASLAGFVPAAWGGFDYIGESGGATDTNTIIAVVGLGITLRVR